MKRFFFFLVSAAAALTFLTSTASAAIKPDITLKLYPKGQDVDEGIALGPGESNKLTEAMEEIHRHVYENVTDPFINIYLPKKCNGQMMIICPGGGYKNVWSVHEGELVAEWAVKRGIAACVVIYRLPNKHPSVPLTDIQNTFRYCRANAGKWGVKQIGIIGFSAGGHLAATASTLFVDDITRPDFSILVYPVISLGESRHNGTKKNLIGEAANEDLIEFYSLDKRVTPTTPPAFIALSGDDKGVKPENSILYYRALLRNGVSGELHIYSTGGHGWGFGKRFPEDPDCPDNLGSQRSDFDLALERWLAAIF